MPIHVALHHSTHYRYDRLVGLSPHLVRLRPAPHCRTPILSYSMLVEPPLHFVNWQQDPQSNYIARLAFPEQVRELRISIDLIAEMSVFNPFDFFLEPHAEQYPFAYDATQEGELSPFLRRDPLTPLLAAYVEAARPAPGIRTIDFLVELNQKLQSAISYVIRLEPGVQPPEYTLELGSGSCRDSTWLLVQILRHLGLAARFVSGYLIQLVPDEIPIEGPRGATQDFTDLHAWCEVYLPGAGWIGLDPTSGLLAGEGHIPLSCTPEPSSAAPVTGAVDDCEVEFFHEMSVRRLYESPRVTKPYRDEQWDAIVAAGHAVDARLVQGDVRLTMGGEPTFVSIDDRDGAEWNTEAMGPIKRLLAADLLWKLRARFGPKGVVHFGQGKWYPGEQLPRWALSCYWRTDGDPVWQNAALIANERRPDGRTAADAERFIRALAVRLGLTDENVQAAHEDAWYYLWRERRLPVNVDPFDARLDDEMERDRLRRVFSQQLDSVVGYAFPLGRTADNSGWRTNPFFLRDERLYLMPGDSAVGYRLPLDSLPWVAGLDFPHPTMHDPMEPRLPLASAASMHTRVEPAPTPRMQDETAVGVTAGVPGSVQAGVPTGDVIGRDDVDAITRRKGEPGAATLRAGGGDAGVSRRGDGDGDSTRDGSTDAADALARFRARQPLRGESAVGNVRTALCTEARDGILYVFLPPIGTAEHFLELIAAIEDTAAQLACPVLLEGYPPPSDPRLRYFQITPDPGVIEVNIQPASSWDELVAQTAGLYEDAQQSRLSSEKFMIDGRHVGTGGGNHFVLGGAAAPDSPFLRRPDLLRSLVAYWHNHPSLSYLFSGLFLGPTSQAPRVDEARHESVYELEIAFGQLEAAGASVPPWLVDRVFRHLLTDMTGNTHRAEFCIDKLYSPDSASGRRGLLEMRAFEMPPHARMSLAQQLLLRSLVARFWEQPYKGALVRWGTELHDRFMLPFFVQLDFDNVVSDLEQSGYPVSCDWFDPHFEFRFPLYGDVSVHGIHVSIRHALEPWHVLGEEGTPGGTARFVDSSIERLQVLATGLTPDRYVVTCNSRPLPLQPTGRNGEYVAGVRYRAWQPPSCLHPTIPVQAPLTFDIVDTWQQRSLAGCEYHVMHPGGRNYSTRPVNSFEAESRRLARFSRLGHTQGRIDIANERRSREFPFTLDLRRPPDA